MTAPTLTLKNLKKLSEKNKPDSVPSIRVEGAIIHLGALSPKLSSDMEKVLDESLYGLFSSCFRRGLYHPLDYSSGG